MHTVLTMLTAITHYCLQWQSPCQNTGICTAIFTNTYLYMQKYHILAMTPALHRRLPRKLRD